jgi:probable HAF family extracellular repeat protein
MMGLGTLPGGTASSASGVSADGSVVVGRSLASSWEAFRWTSASGLVPIGDLPGGGVSSSASDVSADGMVVVGESDSEIAPREGFRWTPQTGMQGIGAWNIATAVSDDGAVVVGYIDSGIQVFRWTAGDGAATLNPCGAASSVSADGAIVVGSADVDATNAAECNAPVAFVWDAECGMRSLAGVLARSGAAVDGWQLASAAISADGRTVVGGGTNPSGQSEAWRAVLPPWPTLPQCMDGLDNDGDGHVDLDDPGCPSPYFTPEDPPCQDGIDNDGDGLVDAADPQCMGPMPNWEEPCGLGAGLAGPIPLLIWLRSRRRRLPG